MNLSFNAKGAILLVIFILIVGLVPYAGVFFFGILIGVFTYQWSTDVFFNKKNDRKY